MASTSETGHAKNVANFQKLIAFIRTYGAGYNPSKDALKLSQLEVLLANAERILADVINKNTIYNNKVNERKMAFANLKSLSTRLVNALRSTNASKEMIDDAKGFNRKMQGKRASFTAAISLDINMPIPNLYSTSQQSYIQQVQHFAGLVAVLESEPTYAPNETEFQIFNLQAKQNELSLKNNEVVTAYTLVTQARVSRNTIFYFNENSLYEVAADVKNYVKSVYGTKSQEYIHIKGITFTKLKG